MSKFPKLMMGAAVVALTATPVFAEKLGLGRPATEDEIAAWNVDVGPDGQGLPVGSGSALDGEAVFVENCAVCHGDFAEGRDNWPKLAGGDGTLADKDPLKTVGSYWPYLTTAWDYVHRSMPFGNAQSLSPDDVYGIVAYILYSNDLVEEDFVLSNENLASFEMPNAGGFIVDDRETSEKHFWNPEPCYENCKESVEITMRAAVLDVTPEETAAKAAAAEEAKQEEMASAEEPKAEEAAPAAAAAAPAADPALVEAGEKVFKKCAACHQVGEGAKNKTGPVLNNVVGAKMAHIEGFRYSKPMQAAHEEGRVWDSEALHGFLANPKAYMKGTKMTFAGLKKAEDIDAVIAYLATQTE